MSAYPQELLDKLHISPADIADFLHDNSGLCGIDLSRVSGLLIAQLASASKHRVFDAFSVTDVMQELEGSGRGAQVKYDAFKHMPLRGLWKAHFFDAIFLPRNIIEHWGLRFEDSPKHAQLCAEVAAEEEAEPSAYGWQGRIAHRLTVGGLEERAMQGKLTGEWIVFGKHDGLNYYLSIAKHTSTPDEDNALYSTIKHYCAPAFPFLFDPQGG